MNRLTGCALDRFVKTLQWFGVYELVEEATDWLLDKAQRGRP